MGLPTFFCSVNNATLNRFFALHFVLPFVLAALALMHLIALHDRAGSGNPLGISGNSDRLAFAPFFLFKDLITIFIFILVLSIFVFFMPNALGDSENYVVANPMQTPPAIELNILCVLPPISSVNYSDTARVEDEINLDKENSVSENNLSLDYKEISNEAQKGFITIQNKKQEVSKLELLNLIESTKEKILQNNSPGAPLRGGGVPAFAGTPPWVGSLPTAHYPARVRVCGEAAGDALLFFAAPPVWAAP
jgi:hypothetical protein